MTTEKTYLGDGLYASREGERVVLAAENGIETTNAVYLEPSVVEAFLRYVRPRHRVGTTGGNGCVFCSIPDACAANVADAFAAGISIAESAIGAGVTVDCCAAHHALLEGHREVRRAVRGRRAS